MSENVSNASVEDVLASIRRLVSQERGPSGGPDNVLHDETREQSQATITANGSTAGDRLVLTPAFRVGNSVSEAQNAGDAAEQNAMSAGTGTGGPSDSSVAKSVSDDHQDGRGRDAAVARRAWIHSGNHDERDHGSSSACDEISTLEIDGTNNAAEHELTLKGGSGSGKPSCGSHASEDAVGADDGASRDNPPSVKDTALGDEPGSSDDPTSVLRLDETDRLPDEFTSLPDDASSAEEQAARSPKEFLEETLPGNESAPSGEPIAASDDEDPRKAGAPDVSPAANKAVPGSMLDHQNDDQNPDGETGDQPEADGLNAVSAASPLRLEPEDRSDVPAYDPEVIPATRQAQHDGSQEVDQVDEISAQAEGIVDEDTLHDLVAGIVREELNGELGERITRNVRKLVRREIQRALAMKDFD